MSRSRLSQIAQTRKTAGLSTTQLAYRLGVNQSTLVRLEQSERRGAISLASLERAAHALGCDLRCEFVPRQEPAALAVCEAAGPNAYATRVVSSRRSRSAVAEMLRSEELAAARGLDAEGRLRRALELSDFAMKLKLCSSKR